MSILLVVSILGLLGFSQTAFASVELNDSEFHEGDTIIISGNIERPTSSSVTIQILYDGNLINVLQAELDKYGDYGHIITAGGALWKYQGEYVVRVSHGEGRIFETSFTFLDGESFNKPQIINDTNTITYSELSEENDQLKNRIMQLENNLEYTNQSEELGTVIQSLQKQLLEVTAENKKLLQTIDELEKQVNNLSQIIQEQIKVIFDWVISK